MSGDVTTALAIAGPEAAETPQSYRAVFLTALATILCLAGAAGGWGMYARLDSAVVTHGVLLAESERKTVDHLEGGILEGLRVRPGDHVAQGQIVATLDATQIREQLAQLDADRTALLFDIWRLESEEAGAQELAPMRAPAAAELERDARMAAQQRLFHARGQAHVGQVAALRRRIDQLTAQIAASGAQALSAERQLASWSEERALTDALVAKGATPRQRLLEFDRSIALLEGTRDENRGLMDAAREEIARAEIDIETLEQQRLVEIAERLSEARRLVDGLTSRIRAAGEVAERHNLRAPQAGLVVDIRTITPGAVIGPGAALMDIVPDGDRLVVQTRLPPEAIDTVYPGRSASVRMTAYSRSQAPVVEGEVTYVSADLLEDERDGTAYFEARISLDPAALDAMPDLSLTAGMPAEVAIRTGERRAGDYFLEPILRHMRRAFREE